MKAHLHLRSFQFVYELRKPSKAYEPQVHQGRLQTKQYTASTPAAIHNDMSRDLIEAVGKPLTNTVNHGDDLPRILSPCGSFCMIRVKLCQICLQAVRALVKFNTITVVNFTWMTKDSVEQAPLRTEE